MITPEQQQNPARSKLKAPFLRKKKQASPDRLPPKKQPFCRAAIAVKQSARKQDCCPPQSHTGTSSPPTTEIQTVERELIRKKSELLCLNLKYIELHEKYSALMERSNRSAGCFESDIEEISSIDDRKSQVDQRTERLAAIKARLARLDFSNCNRLASSSHKSKEK